MSRMKNLTGGFGAPSSFLTVAPATKDTSPKIKTRFETLTKVILPIYYTNLLP